MLHLQGADTATAFWVQIIAFLSVPAVIIYTLVYLLFAYLMKF